MREGPTTGVTEQHSTSQRQHVTPQVLIMEMSAYFKRMRIKALVEWIPRTANREADALANGNVAGFNPALEVKIDDKVLEWLTLPEVLAMGKEAEETFQAASFWTEQTPTSRRPVVNTATGRSGQE